MFSFVVALGPPRGTGRARGDRQRLHPRGRRGSDSTKPSTSACRPRSLSLDSALQLGLCLIERVTHRRLEAARGGQGPCQADERMGQAQGMGTLAIARSSGLESMNRVGRRAVDGQVPETQPQVRTQRRWRGSIDAGQHLLLSGQSFGVQDQYWSTSSTTRRSAPCLCAHRLRGLAPRRLPRECCRPQPGKHAARRCRKCGTSRRLHVHSVRKGGARGAAVRCQALRPASAVRRHRRVATQGAGSEARRPCRPPPAIGSTSTASASVTSHSPNAGTPSSSGSAATARAMSSVKPPANTLRRRSTLLSASPSRSHVHSSAARKVRWRGGALRRRSAPPRQRTLRAALEWTCDLLGDAESEGCASEVFAAASRSTWLVPWRLTPTTTVSLH